MQLILGDEMEEFREDLLNALKRVGVGGNVREAGIADVSTTMIYTHVLNRGRLGVRSSADRLGGE